MSGLRAITGFVVPKLRSVVRFFAAQGITMLGNLLYGLLCVRILPASEYAKFVVLFAVQGTLVILMDVNFSGTLIPLIGDRVDNKQLIADYVASLRRLALRVFATVGLGLAIFYPFLVKNRNWSWKVVAAMVVTLLVSSWFIRVASAYQAVLILMRDRDFWYRGQMISSLGTLALLGLFWFFHAVSGFAAILINVSGIVFTGLLYFFRARRLLGVRGEASSEKVRSIVKLAAPNVPQSIFYALQGQIPMFVITFLGRTVSVAGIGALGRLGQMFALFIQMGPLLVEPYFAKLPRNRLKASYLSVLSIAAVGCIGIALLSSLFPGVFLWVLGPTYSNLRVEVALAIVASAISCLSSVLWFVHSARRFVYWWSNITIIVLIFMVQFAFIVKTDISSLRMVLWMNVATNTVTLLINIVTGIYGFVRGPRQVEDTRLSDSEKDALSLIEVQATEQEAILSTSFNIAPHEES
jgi:O-antigen/teichoic acid export membrane protein